MVYCLECCCLLFFFNQKTAYEKRISDWSSDVCSSDLAQVDQGLRHHHRVLEEHVVVDHAVGDQQVVLQAFGVLDRGGLRVGLEVDVGRVEIGRASCRERVCQYV